MNKVHLFKGGISIDDRGTVSFVNDFNFNSVKRFYIVENHKQGFIRAWHAHKNETKYVMVVKGSALIGVVQINDWENPSKEQPVERFVLSEKQPSVLYIPKGHANGFMSLTGDLKIMFFSTSTLEDSENDDYRYDARYWNPWNIEER
ncbi:MAG: dTDP-4-dehydrorhamnose 3,5-epimerase family protein [Candidatus Marinimicrobia bacterium]|nr:dTDP-4-dehydrorhamnose 3,5-epimerase family protein [Candidatus Neomarinimicrobiota bacterium]